MYDVDKLMAETRRLAREYYQTMGQTLPVSHDLAIYDASRLLTLSAPEQTMPSVDLLDHNQQSIQVKSRVMLDPDKTSYRIGQFNLAGDWDHLYLVLMNAEYDTIEIYSLPHSIVEQHAQNNKRGAMSVAKFKALGESLYLSG